MRRYLPFIIVALVGLVTIGAGTMLYRSKRPAPITVLKTEVPKGEKAESAHVRGPANAPVTLEEFADFQCPPCGALAGPLLEIEKDYGPKLRVIFRSFPFAIHRHAHTAAFAVEAAALQGRFWEMHDLLYKEQANWSKAEDARQLFESYAQMLGVDVERFKRDMNSEIVHDRVEGDQALGSRRGVKNTPTIFVNNQPVPQTSLNPNGMRAAIDEALHQTPAQATR